MVEEQVAAAAGEGPQMQQNLAEIVEQVGELMIQMDQKNSEQVLLLVRQTHSVQVRPLVHQMHWKIQSHLPVVVIQTDLKKKIITSTGVNIFSEYTNT